MGKGRQSVRPAVTVGEAAGGLDTAWIGRAEKAAADLNAACDRAESLLRDVRGAQGDMSTQLRETRAELTKLTGEYLHQDIRDWLREVYETQLRAMVLKEVDAARGSILEGFKRLKNLLLFGNEQGTIGEFNIPGVIYQIVVDRENGEQPVITNAHPDSIGDVIASRRIMP